MIRRLSWGPRFGRPLLLAGCASMPPDVERAEFRKPQPWIGPCLRPVNAD